MESVPGTLAASRPELLEISDLVVDFDLETMSRRPVNRAEVVERLNRVGDRGARDAPPIGPRPELDQRSIVLDSAGTPARPAH